MLFVLIRLVAQFFLTKNRISFQKQNWHKTIFLWLNSNFGSQFDPSGIKWCSFNVKLSFFKVELWQLVVMSLHWARLRSLQNEHIDITSCHWIKIYFWLALPWRKIEWQLRKKCIHQTCRNSIFDILFEL